MSDSPALDPNEWLDTHGDALFRFAFQHLRNESLAEDAVQETLLAAYQGREKFSGQASERTWLISILKHKIVDLIRKRGREPAYEDIETMASHADPIEDEGFDSRGEWVHPATSWGVPDKALEQKRFWTAFDLCMGRLPDRLAQIFSLRELSGLSTEDICKELEITSTNCWVMLYRARLTLKECLETQWQGN
jgi:RNA polymerase sigma-70 factor (ECF subfamily)